MQIDYAITAAELKPAVARMFALAAGKTLRLQTRWNLADGAPVVTAAGRYMGRNWTQWTQGFAYGNALLCFDATGERALLVAGREGTRRHMAEHVTHMGVHDHGFNTMSTYGQLRRLALQGRFRASADEVELCDLAIKASGAVQAARWTPLAEGAGYIHSFNGAHSLFIDTMRTLRVCAVAHVLGHALLGEQDRRISLLGRLLTHAQTSARYNVYFGEGRDAYDPHALRGRTVHEAIFNPASGVFRCPSTQQGYSPFTTWTRGLAWAMLGFAEQLEFVQALPEAAFAGESMAKLEAVALMQTTARACCDFYREHGSALDGICYWDTGAPGMAKLGAWQERAADPFNQHEPVDASASAIGAQGLIRLGTALGDAGYLQAGLTVAKVLLAEPYLSVGADHEGVLLHSIYHRPNGWDYVAPGAAIPYGESSMWGDYHLLELGLLLNRVADGRYYTFFDGLKGLEAR